VRGGTRGSSTQSEVAAAASRARAPVVLLTVLAVATAGLVYELLAGAIATTVLGNSLRQYSITIGVYLFAMGLGAYASKFLDDKLAQRFVEVEYATALIGGTQGMFLFAAYGRAEAFSVLLYGSLMVVGALVGLEIPLLMRILQRDLELKELVAKVLAFDYLGALLGSLVFSVVLVETLRVPLERIGLLFGLLNCAVGMLAVWALAPQLDRKTQRGLYVRGALVALALFVALAYASKLRITGEQELYSDRITYVEQSAYQRIVLTQTAQRVQLFLDGNLQLSSLDEYRYHEALVHPAMAAAARRESVLILGGGDGLAVREALRYPELKQLVLVDLDDAVTRLARTLPPLAALNAGSLDDPRVRIVHDDAFVWLDEAERSSDKHQRALFDIVIADFPDPNNLALGKLYSQRFYELVKARLREGGVLAVQSTSPLFARQSYWCVERTIAAAGFATLPYHALVPSFGEWGYVLATHHAVPPPRALRTSGLRYLNDATLAGLFALPSDLGPVEVEVNRLNQPVLVHYYAQEQAEVF
jgi:spermidine synthase